MLLRIIPRGCCSSLRRNDARTTYWQLQSARACVCACVRACVRVRVRARVCVWQSSTTQRKSCLLPSSVVVQSTTARLVEVNVACTVVPALPPIYTTSSPGIVEPGGVCCRHRRCTSSTHMPVCLFY